jgi:hypothetical protein
VARMGCRSLVIAGFKSSTRQPDDWTHAHTIAAGQPAKLRKLQDLFPIEASKYNGLPLDPRQRERYDAEIAGRPMHTTMSGWRRPPCAPPRWSAVASTASR